MADFKALPVDVVTVGESMVLFQSMADGPLQYASLFSKSVAGAESNVSIGLARLGLKVRWISRLGVDPFGDLILATLGGEGIDTSFTVRDASAPTAVYFKEFKGYGDPNVYYYRRNSAASRFAKDEVRSAWFEGAKHLHVTGITPALGPTTADAVRAAMRMAKSMGLTVSFDPNLRRKLWSESEARETLLSMVPLCDIFLPGIEEAEFLLGSSTVEAYGRRFLEMGPKVVALKLGADGSMAFASLHQVEADPYRVQNVVDTVGAGDAFAAGFLSVLLDDSAIMQWLRESERESNPEFGHVLKQALTRANLMGALATQWKGDWEGLPRLPEVLNLLAGRGSVTR